jgi:hypothetical protein
MRALGFFYHLPEFGQTTLRSGRAAQRTSWCQLPRCQFGANNMTRSDRRTLARRQFRTLSRRQTLLAGIGLEKTGNPKCNPMLEGLTADSEEKHEPASDIRQCSGG